MYSRMQRKKIMDVTKRSKYKIPQGLQSFEGSWQTFVKPYEHLFHS